MVKHPEHKIQYFYLGLQIYKENIKILKQIQIIILSLFIHCEFPINSLSISLLISYEFPINSL